eukprot:355871-Chlamydomonas_euryale.AAC.5
MCGGRTRKQQADVGGAHKEAAGQCVGGAQGSSRPMCGRCTRKQQANEWGAHNLARPVAQHKEAVGAAAP